MQNVSVIVNKRVEGHFKEKYVIGVISDWLVNGISMLDFFVQYLYAFTKSKIPKMVCIFFGFATC